MAAGFASTVKFSIEVLKSLPATGTTVERGQSDVLAVDCGPGIRASVGKRRGLRLGGPRQVTGAGISDGNARSSSHLRHCRMVQYLEVGTARIEGKVPRSNGAVAVYGVLIVNMLLRGLFLEWFGYRSMFRCLSRLH